jgi:hypothetical protein
VIHPPGRLFPLFVFLTPAVVAGQQPGAASAFGEALKVSLVTVEQGDLVWERFGHNAILFQDEASGWEVAYHWGIFNFGQVDFVPRLIRGTMLYSMGPNRFQDALEEYRRAGRRVWVQELALTPTQGMELLAAVEENARPENRDYRYDYYRDNCSTRVRDALDRVLGGLLEARFSSDTTAFTYRWHTRRILQEMPPYYLGIQFVLGPRADRLITVWEEMFLPQTVKDRIGEVQVPGPDGSLRSLVTRERVAVESGRPEAPARPPFALPIFLGVGLLWGGAMLLLSGKEGASGLPRRLGVALAGGVWTLLAGLGGSLLLGAWLFTDHVFWHNNFNLFQTNPLFLPLPVGFLMFLVTGRLPAWAMRVSWVVAALSVGGVALELLPFLGQANGEILGLTVPMNLALLATCRRLPAGEGVPEAKATTTA